MTDTTTTMTETELAIVPDDPQAEDIRLLRRLPYQPVPVLYLPMHQTDMLFRCVERGLCVLQGDDFATMTYRLTEAGEDVHLAIYGDIEQTRDILPVCCVACYTARGAALPAACHLAPCVHHQEVANGTR